MKIIDDMYKDLEDKNVLKVNKLYFESLYKKFMAHETKELILKEVSNDSKVIPLPIASTDELKNIEIQDYENLKSDLSPNLANFGLRVLKMQAGLGSSVKRDDLILKYDNRTTLGSKGTDLFIPRGEQMISIAEAQIDKALCVSKKNIYQYVAFQNLINSETMVQVNKIWNNIEPQTQMSYAEIFSKNESIKKYPELFQLMMPTINNKGELTQKRVAPAGHAFLGFSLLYQIFIDTDIASEIIVIGNGEDLNSLTDEKIHSWMVDQNIPIAMITTTKTAGDKKGGQLALNLESTPFVTIVEKAQAQKAGQLEYFEKLGLRPTDQKSLFNTNIVVINTKSLKQAFKEFNVTDQEFMAIIAPDLIKNTKEQGGQHFTQLEGAIGSTLLNLDKYGRENYNKSLVSFLNLNEKERKLFFVPIKKREDFDAILT